MSKIAADLGPGHGLEEALRDLLRIAVEETDPFDVPEPDEPLEEAGQAVPEAAVPAVKGRVLGDEVDLPDPEAGQGAGFADDGGRAPRAIGALDQGDGAEGAPVGTALGDLEVGPGPGCRDEARRGVGIEERPAGPRDRTALDDGDDLVEAPDASPGVDPGELRFEVVPVPLDVAAGDDDLFAGLRRSSAGVPRERLFGLVAGRRMKPQVLTMTMSASSGRGRTRIRRSCRGRA